MPDAKRLRVRPMLMEDLPLVAQIERHSFCSPWSTDAFYAELCNAGIAHCIVLETFDGSFCGYAIFHFIIDEIHLVNIAVAPERRRMGCGDKLLRAVFRLGADLGGTYFTLEVRATNHVAQALYLKHGFQSVALRRGYYEDKGEDALVMAFTGVPDVSTADFDFAPSLGPKSMRT